MSAVFMRPAMPVWSLAEVAPDLWRRAVSAELAALVDPGRIPVAVRGTPFVDGRFERPYRHLRAFYQYLEGGGVLAIKGSEILAEDTAATLTAMGALRVDYPARGRSLLSYLEHFPIVEQKIPLALPVAEAIEDCQAALAVQQAHLDRFGTLARAPLPLLAARWDDDACNRHLERLLPLLSPRAGALVKGVAADGLAVMLYAYPSLPLRVAHLDHTLGLAGAGGYEGRKARLAAHVDPAATIAGWVELAARLLALGFLPGSIESLGIGHCLEAQNAVIDGGFVDLGSIKPLAAVRDPWEIRQSLHACLADLARTARIFLLGGMADCDAEYRNPSPVMSLLTTTLWDELRRRLEQLDRQGGLPAEVAAWIGSASAFDAMDSGLSLLFPAHMPGSDHA